MNKDMYTVCSQNLRGHFFHGLRPKNLILGPKWAYFGRPDEKFFSHICAYTNRVDLCNKNDGLRYFFHGLRPKNLILGPKWAKWAYFGQPDEKKFFSQICTYTNRVDL